MWLLSYFVGNELPRERELLFDTEQDVKDYIKRWKPVQWTVRYIKKHYAD